MKVFRRLASAIRFLTKTALVLFVAWIAIWLYAMVFPSVITTEGAVGPFAIGQTKAEVREILEAHDKWPPHPSVAEDKWVERVDLEALETAFEEDDGIIVQFCCGSQTRLNFEDKKLVRIWPEIRLDDHRAQYREAWENSVRFRDTLSIGMSKSDAVSAISKIDVSGRISVSNHLVGKDRYWRLYSGSAKLIDFPEYSDFVYRANGWRFSGFKELAWYGWLFRPWKARLYLSFRNDRLYRIEYFSAPAELP